MKKFIMTIVTLFGLLIALYVYRNTSIFAAPAQIDYYNVGDVFERTGKNTFEMGGLDWTIAHADLSNGKALILSENLVPLAGCGSTYITQSSVSTCFAKANSMYLNNANVDDTGKLIEKKSGKGTISIPSVNDYNIITNKETDLRFFNQIGLYEFWLDEIYQGQRVLYYGPDYNPYPQYNDGTTTYTELVYIPYIDASCELRVLTQIDLPQKGIINSITADSTKVTIPYIDTKNTAGSTFVSIDTNAGQGPYHFYLYDTDANGNGNYLNPSAYFTINADTQNGTAKIKSINTLPVADYYFKVRVVDESTNDRLYYDSNDFTKDTYRTKETGVIHVSISKISPTIAFNDPNLTKKSISEANTSWYETAIATPMTNDLQIKYTIVSGDASLITLDENTGQIAYKGNGFGKVKIRATVDELDPNGHNYQTAFTEKEIVIYREVDGNMIPDPASSDTSIPTFAANDTNIKIGGTIGKIQGTLGTPDTIGSSVTTYSYAIKSDSSSDGSLFQVNASSGVIKTNANLGVDTYNFVIIVSDKWSSKEIPVTVSVGMAPAENLKFYQSPTSNTIITTKSAALTDTGVTVFATVKVTLRHSINSIINHSFYAK